MRPPEKIDQNVYHESRYREEGSPNVNYIPRKEMMWKLMRSCIGVEDPNGLWINAS